MTPIENPELITEAKRLIKTSVISFFLTFKIGILLLEMYMMLDDPSDIVLAGIIFIMMAFFFNASVLINNIICLTKCREHRLKLFFTSLLLLLNVPIFAYYITIFL